MSRFALTRQQGGSHGTVNRRGAALAANCGGRAFGVAFPHRLRVDRRSPLRRAYRDDVERQLVAEFGVPLPTALDWLVAAACRRKVPADEMTGFLGQLFDLEPLSFPASRRSR